MLLANAMGVIRRTSGISYCLVGPSGEHGPPTSVLLRQERAELQPSVLGKIKQPDNWGMGVESEDDKLTLLKLALPGDELQGGVQHPEHLWAVQTELSKISAAGYDGVTVLAEYMNRMWAVARLQLERHVEADLGGSVPATLTVGFVFGIPAVWGEQVVERMRQAITESGMTNQATFTDLIIEPEAAALNILPSLVEEGVVKVRASTLHSYKPCHVYQSALAPVEAFGALMLTRCCDRRMIVL